MDPTGQDGTTERPGAERRVLPGERPFRRARRPEERVRVLGAAMDLVRAEEVLLHVWRAVEAGRPTVVANHNLHSLYLARRNPVFRAFYDRAELIEVDSTPILLWAKLTQGRGRRFHRCTYLDWRGAFWALAERAGWRVFYLGGAPGVAERAAGRLRPLHPRATIAVRDGYFDTAGPENAAVLAEIAAFRPHVLLVGMGMPRQELWLAANAAALPPCAMLPVGAAFDYEAGVQPTPPRWVGRWGFEWAWRLAADPRRLFTRYCVEPWSLIPAALADLRDAALRSLGPRAQRPPPPDEAVRRRGEWRPR